VRGLPSRERQIEVMTGVKERLDEIAKRWLALPEFKAALRAKSSQPERKE